MQRDTAFLRAANAPDTDAVIALKKCGAGGGSLLGFTASWLLEFTTAEISQKRQISKKNTVAVDSLNWTETCVWQWSSILVTCCQALLERRVFFRRLCRVRSVSREGCGWSCGALTRLFLGESMSSLSSS